MSFVEVFTGNPEAIEGQAAVWLYGSYARGDVDDSSDVDVLYVAEDCESDLGLGMVGASCENISVSRYSWNEIEGMAAYGSLFLHHLRLEGRSIVESRTCKGRLACVLGRLGPYRLASRDLAGFRQVLDDVVDSLSDGHASLHYELSTLGTVLRHASILGCGLRGDYCFSRKQPVQRMMSFHNLPRQWMYEFQDLYDYRLLSDGRRKVFGEPSIDLARMWCSRTRLVLDALEKQIHDQS